jgi:hypothetical protein
MRERNPAGSAGTWDGEQVNTIRAMGKRERARPCSRLHKEHANSRGIPPSSLVPMRNMDAPDTLPALNSAYTTTTQQ